VSQPIRIGVSACLLGQEVRYDGGHKRDPFLVETFGRYVEWVHVCPEVEIGLGTPRDPIRLERAGRDVRLVNPKTGTDLTRKMRTYAARRLAALEDQDLCGYILKKDSPSCGLERVRVHDGRGMPSRNGRGLFAAALLRRCPNLPVEEEGRLNDPRIRENFVERVFAYRRLRSLFAGRWTIGDLARFHTAQRLQLFSHSPSACARLGRLVARARAIPRPRLRARYEAEFMAALTPATDNAITHA